MDLARSLINLPNVLGIELGQDREAASCTLPPPCPSFPYDGRPRLPCPALRGLPSVPRIVVGPA